MSDDSEDIEDFDVGNGNEDVEDRPSRPSHVNFGKSTVKKGHIEAMKGRYFHDVSIVRAGGEKWSGSFSKLYESCNTPKSCFGYFKKSSSKMLNKIDICYNKEIKENKWKVKRSSYEINYLFE